MSNGTKTTQNVTAYMPDFQINRVKSDRVQQCKKTLSELDKKKGKLEEKNKILDIFLVLSIILATYLCVAMACACYIPWCSVSMGGCPFWVFMCGLGLAIVGCIGGMLNSAIEELEAKVGQLKVQKRDLCASEDPGSMYQSLSNIGDSGMSMESTTYSIVCAVGVAVMMLGLMMMMPAPATPPPAGSPPATPPPQLY